MSLGLYLDYEKEVHPLLIARWSQGFISGQGQTSELGVSGSSESDVLTRDSRRRRSADKAWLKTWENSKMECPCERIQKKKEAGQRQMGVRTEEMRVSQRDPPSSWGQHSTDRTWAEYTGYRELRAEHQHLPRSAS